MIPDYSPTESKIVFNNVNHIHGDGVAWWSFFINVSEAKDWSAYPNVGVDLDLPTKLYHHAMLPISVA